MYNLLLFWSFLIQYKQGITHSFHLQLNYSNYDFAVTAGLDAIFKHVVSSMIQWQAQFLCISLLVLFETTFANKTSYTYQVKIHNF